MASGGGSEGLSKGEMDFKPMRDPQEVIGDLVGKYRNGNKLKDFSPDDLADIFGTNAITVEEALQRVKDLREALGKHPVALRDRDKQAISGLFDSINQRMIETPDLDNSSTLDLATIATKEDITADLGSTVNDGGTDNGPADNGSTADQIEGAMGGVASGINEGRINKVGEYAERIRAVQAGNPIKTGDSVEQLARDFKQITGQEWSDDFDFEEYKKAQTSPDDKGKNPAGANDSPETSDETTPVNTETEQQIADIKDRIREFVLSGDPVPTDEGDIMAALNIPATANEADEATLEDLVRQTLWETLSEPEIVSHAAEERYHKLQDLGLTLEGQISTRRQGVDTGPAGTDESAPDFDIDLGQEEGKLDADAMKSKIAEVISSSEPLDEDETLETVLGLPGNMTLEQRRRVADEVWMILISPENTDDTPNFARLFALRNDFEKKVIIDEMDENTRPETLKNRLEMILSGTVPIDENDTLESLFGLPHDLTIDQRKKLVQTLTDTADDLYQGSDTEPANLDEYRKRVLEYHHRTLDMEQRGEQDGAESQEEENYEDIDIDAICDRAIELLNQEEEIGEFETLASVLELPERMSLAQRREVADALYETIMAQQDMDTESPNFRKIIDLRNEFEEELLEDEDRARRMRQEAGEEDDEFWRTDPQRMDFDEAPEPAGPIEGLADEDSAPEKSQRRGLWIGNWLREKIRKFQESRSKGSEEQSTPSPDGGPTSPEKSPEREDQEGRVTRNLWQKYRTSTNVRIVTGIAASAVAGLVPGSEAAHAVKILVGALGGAAAGDARALGKTERAALDKFSKIPKNEDGSLNLENLSKEDAIDIVASLKEVSSVQGLRIDSALAAEETAFYDNLKAEGTGNKALDLFRGLKERYAKASLGKKIGIAVLAGLVGLGGSWAVGGGAAGMAISGGIQLMMGAIRSNEESGRTAYAHSDEVEQVQQYLDSQQVSADEINNRRKEIQAGRVKYLAVGALGGATLAGLIGRLSHRGHGDEGGDQHNQAHDQEPAAGESKPETGQEPSTGDSKTGTGAESPNGEGSNPDSSANTNSDPSRTDNGGVDTTKPEDVVPSPNSRTFKDLWRMNGDGKAEYVGPKPKVDVKVDEVTPSQGGSDRNWIDGLKSAQQEQSAGQSPEASGSPFSYKPGEIPGVPSADNKGIFGLPETPQTGGASTPDVEKAFDFKGSDSLKEELIDKADRVAATSPHGGEKMVDHMIAGLRGKGQLEGVSDSEIGKLHDEMVAKMKLDGILDDSGAVKDYAKFQETMDPYKYTHDVVNHMHQSGAESYVQDLKEDVAGSAVGAAKTAIEGDNSGSFAMPVDESHKILTETGFKDVSEANLDNPNYRILPKEEMDRILDPKNKYFGESVINAIERVTGGDPEKLRYAIDNSNPGHPQLKFMVGDKMVGHQMLKSYDFSNAQRPGWLGNFWNNLWGRNEATQFDPTKRPEEMFGQPATGDHVENAASAASTASPEQHIDGQKIELDAQDAAPTPSGETGRQQIELNLQDAKPGEEANLPQEGQKIDLQLDQTTPDASQRQDIDLKLNDTQVPDRQSIDLKLDSQGPAMEDMPSSVKSAVEHGGRLEGVHDGVYKVVEGGKTQYFGSVNYDSESFRGLRDSMLEKQGLSWDKPPQSFMVDSENRLKHWQEYVKMLATKEYLENKFNGKS